MQALREEFYDIPECARVHFTRHTSPPKSPSRRKGSPVIRVARCHSRLPSHSGWLPLSNEKVRVKLVL